MVLQLETEKIVWPGNLRKKPSGLMIPTHLQVMTINEKPFVYSRQIKPIDKCLEEPCDSCDLKNGEIPCPIYNTTHQDQNGNLFIIIRGATEGEISIILYIDLSNIKYVVP